MENYEKIKQNPLDSLKKKYTNNGKWKAFKEEKSIYVIWPANKILDRKSFRYRK